MLLVNVPIMRVSELVEAKISTDEFDERCNNSKCFIVSKTPAKSIYIGCVLQVDYEENAEFVMGSVFVDNRHSEKYLQDGEYRLNVTGWSLGEDDVEIYVEVFVGIKEQGEEED